MKDNKYLILRMRDESQTLGKDEGPQKHFFLFRFNAVGLRLVSMEGSWIINTPPHKLV
jgi:hypothetical protein